MRIAFFTALVIVLYTYAGYPLCIALMARLRPRPWSRARQAGSASVILPVHNGAALLPWKISSLLAMDSALIGEIIVVLDGCSDASAELLAQVNDPRVRSLAIPQQVGKAAALKRGMELATGEFLLFIDIRPEVTEFAINELLSNFADTSIGCVAGELKVQIDSDHSHTTSAVGGLYWRYEQWIRNCEAAYDSPVGVYGGFYAIRRSLATPPPDGLILDDMFQPLSIIRKGYRSVVDQQAIVYDRWPSTSAGEFDRKVRTLAGNFQLVAQAPWILTFQNRALFQLISHKFLRLLVPYCFIAMLLTSCVLGLHSVVWALIAAAQGALWIAAQLGLHMRLPIVGKVASACGALLLLNAAAVWALWVFAFTPGPLWKIWKATPLPHQARIIG